MTSAKRWNCNNSNLNLNLNPRRFCINWKIPSFSYKSAFGYLTYNFVVYRKFEKEKKLLEAEKKSSKSKKHHTWWEIVLFSILTHWYWNVLQNKYVSHKVTALSLNLITNQDAFHCSTQPTLLMITLKKCFKEPFDRSQISRLINIFRAKTN